jgi:hypothetical protein
MTPEDHNRLLGWGHIAHASFFALMGLMMAAMFGLVGLMAAMDPKVPNDFPGAFFGLFGLIFGLFYVAMALPSFIAGVGLLKRKSWAKIWAIIAGVMSAMSFPIGTAVCVYTFWFMFSDPGKSLYDSDFQAAHRPPAGLYGAAASPGWDYREAKTRQYEYVPPQEPPNWRDG